MLLRPGIESNYPGSWYAFGAHTAIMKCGNRVWSGAGNGAWGSSLELTDRTYTTAQRRYRTASYHEAVPLSGATATSFDTGKNTHQNRPSLQGPNPRQPPTSAACEGG